MERLGFFKPDFKKNLAGEKGDIFLFLIKFLNEFIFKYIKIIFCNP